MSPLSPPEQSHDVKPEHYTDLPTSTSIRSNVTTGHTAGPSGSGMGGAGSGAGGVVWTKDGPVLKMENAVVETVVTHTTRTTTSYAPIPLPRIPQPEYIRRPDYLAPETYPLAAIPTPEDLKVFALNLAGRRVVIQEDDYIHTEPEAGSSSRPGWRRTFPDEVVRHAGSERIDFAQAIRRKEPRKRPHEAYQPGRGAIEHGSTVPTPPITIDTMTPRVRRSPPRKKIRGMDDFPFPHDAGNALLSPLPSPEHESGPSMIPPPVSASTQNHLLPASPPSIGSGIEVAALFSLSSIISEFDTLPDRLQQQVLMHMLRRSRMPTIQRTYSFAGLALKRDFISHLPHEVAIQILKKIDTPSLASAIRVSKKWKKMIDSERVVWQQRMIDDGLWQGLGVEEEDERKILRRMEILDEKQDTLRRSRKADTPTDDEPMVSAASSIPPATEWSVPLKHVYRRRYTSARNWLYSRPEHTSFPGHGTNVVTCLQFDADKIVSASDDHSINVYNTSNGQLRRRLDGHEGGVWALEYKGDTMVSGSTDRTVRIWDMETLTEAHVFYGHTSTVRCLQIIEPVLDEATGEYYPAYPMIVTGSRDATLRVWKLPRKGEPPMRPQLDAAGNEIQIGPDQNPWHVHLLEGHAQAVRAVAAHGRICISGSYDFTVKVWDLVTGQCKHTLTGHEQKVYSVVYDRYRGHCASGSMDNTVKVWNVTTGECLHTLTGHTSLIGLLGVSPNYFVSGAADASLRIWDANNHELRNVLPSNGGAITCFQHDETKVVSGSDGTLKLWDIRTGQYVRDLVIGISSVWQLAFNGNLLVAASDRGGSSVFDVFDFGASSHISGLDDDSLDSHGRQPWERANPREPQEYQVDDIDGVDFFSSIESPFNVDKFLRDSSPLAHRSSGGASRRSSRLAARSGGCVIRNSAPGPLSLEPPPRSRRGARFTMSHDDYLTSPTPAGPSRLGGVASVLRSAGRGQKSEVIGQEESFEPMFDDERPEGEHMDEDVKEEDFGW